MSIGSRDERAMAAGTASAPGPPDEDLLRRFVTDRSDLSFAQLVTRHGPLVMSVCRRILGQQQDAEDAFQATFLVLARKAASLRRAQSLPAWLHKTAYRIALRAKAGNARRREQPLECETMIVAETLTELASDHDQSALDEELNRLPERYRLPLFLCCIEGMPRDEAAYRLGWSPASLKGRLERGRQLLRRRLMLRRVSLGVALALLVRSQQTAQAAVAPSLVASTVQAGVRSAAGQSASGYVSQNALSLANGSFRVMSMTSSKVVLCSLAAVGLLTWGAAWLSAPAVAGGGEINGPVLMLQTAAVSSSEPETLVAFVAAEDGDRPRRSPEAEAGPRRSPETDAGPRRSPEAEAGPRRAAEGAARALGEFRPQTQREAALYQMILQLQREVSELRRELHARGPARERAGAGEPDPAPAAAPRDREQPPALDPASRKMAKIFQAYDKDRSGQVSFDEFLAMREGANDPRVRQQAMESFNQADRTGDGQIALEEFLAAGQRRQEGDQPRGEGAAPRDRDLPGAEADRPRDGDAGRRGPRDGEGHVRDRE